MDCRQFINLIVRPFGLFGSVASYGVFSDTLAHGALLGVALASALNLPADLGILVVSILVVALIYVLEDTRLPSDATLAVSASTLLCLGLITLTMLTQAQANVLGFCLAIY